MPTYSNTKQQSIVDLLNESRQSGARASEERRKEQQRRAMEYRRLALSALSRLHPEDYKRLHAEARELVDSQRGELPE